MATVGGSCESCSIRGRTFPPAGDAKVVIKLGGFSNEVQPNGDGSARIVKKRETPSVEGLVVQVDNDRNDLGFLQEITNGEEFVDFTITLADGNTYQGSLQITDMPGLDTESATAELKLAGEKEITLQ